MAFTLADQYLEAAAASRLVTPEQIATIAALGLRTPNEAASELLARGWLTEWQAKRLLTGEIRFFLGRYRLLRELGRGGMAAVFQGQETGGQRRMVAIKVMAPRLLQNAESVRRFLLESKAVSVLSHPNIVGALDADCINGRHLFVMEYVEGRDLSAWSRKFSKLPVAWVCECLRQAALGLQHAFDRGLIHRDIKPGNLLVLSDAQAHLPRLKILDFGLARFTSQKEGTGLTGDGQVLGTVDYMSPEQAHSTKSVDIRSDIYSLGCTMFHLLTGDVPFPGESALDRLFARTKREAPALRSALPQASAELEAILALMLDSDPNRRFQTPADVAQALAPLSLSEQPELIATQAVHWDGPALNVACDAMTDLQANQAAAPPSPKRSVDNAPTARYSADGPEERKG